MGNKISENNRKFVSKLTEFCEKEDLANNVDIVKYAKNHFFSLIDDSKKNLNDNEKRQLAILAARYIIENVHELAPMDYEAVYSTEANRALKLESLLNEIISLAPSSTKVRCCFIKKYIILSELYPNYYNSLSRVKPGEIVSVKNSAGSKVRVVKVDKSSVFKSDDNAEGKYCIGRYIKNEPSGIETGSVVSYKNSKGATSRAAVVSENPNAAKEGLGRTYNCVDLDTGEKVSVSMENITTVEKDCIVSDRNFKGFEISARDIYFANGEVKAALCHAGKTESFLNSEMALLNSEGTFSSLENNSTTFNGADVDKILFEAMSEYFESIGYDYGFSLVFLARLSYDKERALSKEDIVETCGNAVGVSLYQVFLDSVPKNGDWKYKDPGGCYDIIKMRKCYPTPLDFFFLNSPPDVQEAFFESYVELRTVVGIPPEEFLDIAYAAYLDNGEKVLIK